ncbi:tetratricopeptide repeat-containing glycosyltransferase family 2 protein [Paenibacillus lautus]|uniref:tetratricopeptide repeat-containing glycosyltransferase family 2 protein n=1 Tax=Paenibacillus lautus TaxID=1401 RepID=UPI003D2D8251
MIDHKISVCMIVNNEQEHIGDALSSVKPIAYEIIVVDHGSIDNTRNISEQLGAKVYTREWNKSFSDARNYSISKATGDFILVMDADERLVINEEALKEACEFMKRNSASSIRVEIENITDTDSTTSWVTRFLPNHSNLRFVGRIHEQVMLNHGISPTWDSSIKIIHYGYKTDIIQTKKKAERNIELLQEELENDPRDPYLHFQTGRAYQQASKREEAIESYLNSYQFINRNEPPVYYSTLLLHMIKCYVELKQWDNFLKYVSVALEIYPDYTDLYYIYGVGLIEARNIDWFSQIPQAFESCLAIGEADQKKYETTIGTGSFKAHYNLGLYYELIGNRESSAYHYLESSKYGFLPANERLKLINYKE